jgi:DNA processing protein
MRSLPLGISQNSMPAAAAVSVRRELGAYEALWLEQGATLKTVASKFAIDPTALPSDLVPRLQAEESATKAMEALKRAGVHQFGVRVHHAGDYPPRLS